MPGGIFQNEVGGRGLQPGQRYLIGRGRGEPLEGRMPRPTDTGPEDKAVLVRHCQKGNLQLSVLMRVLICKFNCWFEFIFGVCDSVVAFSLFLISANLLGH